MFFVLKLMRVVESDNVSRVWCADICVLGKTEVFRVMNYGSKKILGFCMKQEGSLVAEEIFLVLNAVLETATLAPDVFLTDQGKVFKSEILIAFYGLHCIKHEAQGGKFQNNRIENFHGRVKGLLVKFFFTRVGLTGLIGKSFWSSLEERGVNIGFIKKLSYAQRANRKDVRKAVFSLPVFQEKLKDWFSEAVEFLNDEPYQLTGGLSKFSPSQVDTYLYHKPAAIPGPNVSRPALEVLQDVASTSLTRTGIAYDKALEMLSPSDENFQALLERIRLDPDGQVKLLLMGFSRVLNKIEQGNEAVISEVRKTNVEVRKSNAELKAYNAELEDKLDAVLRLYADVKAKLDALLQEQKSKPAGEEERRVKGKNRQRRP